MRQTDIQTEGKGDEEEAWKGSRNESWGRALSACRAARLEGDAGQEEARGAEGGVRPRGSGGLGARWPREKGGRWKGLPRPGERHVWLDGGRTRT